MSYADMYALSQQFRSALLRGERDTASAMVSAYASAYQAMQDRINQLLAQIGAAQANGLPVTTSWLWEQDRLQLLMSQIASEIGRFATFANGLVLTQEQQALLAGSLQSMELMQAALPGLAISWVSVPRWQLAHLVGNLQNGSPLQDLFDRMATNGAQEAGKVLFNGVAAGHGPRVIAKQLEKALGAPLDRALRISRTEVLRVYREASRNNFIANSDVVKEWEWSATSGACPFCQSMNGSLHPLTEPMETHPNCRCVLLPRTVSYDEILARVS